MIFPVHHETKAAPHNLVPPDRGLTPGDQRGHLGHMVALPQTENPTMAPIELSVLLHYAETAEPITSRTDTPRTELLDRIGDHLVKDGLLMRGGDERPFCLTRKGEFFVHHLLTTPLPVEEVVYRIPPREEP